MSVIVGACKGGGPGQSEVVMDTLKGLLVACCETNHGSLAKYRLIWPSNVDGTRPKNHDQVCFMSSSSTTQRKDSGDLDLGQYSNTTQSSA